MFQMDHGFKEMNALVTDVVSHCQQGIATKGRPISDEALTLDGRLKAWMTDGL